MKKALFALLCLASLSVSAKKVKFSVNMASLVVDTGGVHITGDFQSEAGFAADWDPGTTGMTQDVIDTNLYHVVVDIPAFRAYEFKFVNGVFGYQQEFVPLESRVNYNFIDSRWIYVDSLANDTLIMGEIRFGGNAPAGKNLVRLYVDMQLQTVSSNGVHVAGSFQNWSVNATRMYSFDGMVYEYITYVDSGLATEREYKFLNGNVSGDYETLPGWCVNGNGNRGVVAPRDTMLPVVCFTFCDACSTVGIESTVISDFGMTPNPASQNVRITFPSLDAWTVSILNLHGQEVFYEASNGSSEMNIEVGENPAGIYFVRTMNSIGQVQIKKLIVE